MNFLNEFSNFTVKFSSNDRIIIQSHLGLLKPPASYIGLSIVNELDFLLTMPPFRTITVTL